MSERDKDIAMQAAIRAERYRVWQQRVRKAAQDPDLTLRDLAERFNVEPGKIKRALA